MPVPPLEATTVSAGSLAVLLASIAAVTITALASVYVAYLNSKTTEKQRYSAARRETLENRRLERRDVYLRWIRATQGVETALNALDHGEINIEDVRIAMRDVYHSYDELSLLDCPRELVELAAWIHRQQQRSVRTFGRNRRRVGDFMIEVNNRMQADLSRGDEAAGAEFTRDAQDRFTFDRFSDQPT